MGYVYAVSNTSVGGPNGTTPTLTEGEVWDADDPLVKARPDLFSKVPTKVRRSNRPTYDARVEQATAAPGEKRR